MSADYFFAVKSIGLSKVGGRKPCTLESAAKHNKRQQVSELEERGRIDASRTHLNYSLAGAGDVAGVLALAEQRMESVGLTHDKMRRDYCQAIEIVFSLPRSTTIDTRQYFADCMAWTAEQFCSVNILSADVHHDESTPHLHVLVAPIAEGRWMGGKLIYKDRTQAMRESFGKLAKRYGLRMSDRLTGNRKADAVAVVLAAIETGHRAFIQSPLWQPMRQAIERNPAPFVDALGLQLTDRPEKRKKEFVDFVVSTGKGAKRETLHLPMRNPIGFDDLAVVAIPIGIDGNLTVRKSAPANPIGIEKQAQSSRSLSCVGIAFSQDRFTPRFKPESIKVTARSYGKEALTIDDDGVITGIDDMQVIACDDGTIRERDHQQEQPDGYDQPRADW